MFLHDFKEGALTFVFLKCISVKILTKMLNRPRFAILQNLIAPALLLVPILRLHIFFCFQILFVTAVPAIFSFNPLNWFSCFLVHMNCAFSLKVFKAGDTFVKC